MNDVPDSAKVYAAWLPHETPGERIARLRDERGLSMEQLRVAANLGSKSTLHEIEQGRDVRLSTLDRIADVFGLTVSDLLAGCSTKRLRSDNETGNY